jgi:hypothetical protein
MRNASALLRSRLSHAENGTKFKQSSATSRALAHLLHLRTVLSSRRETSQHTTLAAGDACFWRGSLIPEVRCAPSASSSRSDILHQLGAAHTPHDRPEQGCASLLCAVRCVETIHGAELSCVSQHTVCTLQCTVSSLECTPRCGALEPCSAIYTCVPRQLDCGRMASAQR